MGNLHCISFVPLKPGTCDYITHSKAGSIIAEKSHCCRSGFPGNRLHRGDLPSEHYCGTLLATLLRKWRKWDQVEKLICDAVQQSVFVTQENGLSVVPNSGKDPVTGSRPPRKGRNRGQCSSSEPSAICGKRLLTRDRATLSGAEGVKCRGLEMRLGLCSTARAIPVVLQF